MSFAMVKIRNIGSIQMLSRPLDDDDYIIGGEDAEPHSRPFQVSYQYRTITGWFHTCGGSILDESRVLTAAHCCLSGVGREMTIVAGEHHLYDDADDGTEQRVEQTEYTIHPLYSSTTLTNDVCVLQLAQPLEMNE